MHNLYWKRKRKEVWGMSKKNKIIWIVLLLIIEVAILFWIQGRYRTILAEGIAYQTPASVDI